MHRTREHYSTRARLGLVAALLVASVAARAQVQFAAVTLFQPDKFFDQASRTITYGGTIDILQTVNSWNIRVVHLYLEGTNSTANRIDAGLPAQEFLDWLAATPESNVAGAHYSGPIWNMYQEETDVPGYYWHLGGSINQAAEFFLQGSNGPDWQSNRVTYSVTVTPVPEPATMSLMALGLSGVLRKRRQNV